MEKNEKKCQVHLIKTTKPCEFVLIKQITDSRGIRISNSLLEYSNNSTYIRNALLINNNNANTNSKSKYELYHLYITSDDEIKEGDWFYSADYNVIDQLKTNGNIYENNCKKIIATTDKELWTKSKITGSDSFLNSPLPQPSESFIQTYIESYNKGEVIKEVMVEYENIFDPKGVTIIDEYSIVPNNHLRVKVNPKDNTITIRMIQDSWNKEEVTKLCNESYLNGIRDFGVDNHNNWLYAKLNS
jgi:hypothetical protein